jgi:F-type H+-transporting ATPase subunit alpha
VLREVLMQDRLDPHSPLDQMAWLVACNEGLLDELSGTSLHDALQALRDGVSRSDLSLDNQRSRWLDASRGWLATWGAHRKSAVLA